MNRSNYSLISLIFILLFGTGCATTKGYEKILNSWTGMDRDDLVLAWGQPDNSFKTTNGNTIWVYKDVETVYTSAYMPPIQTSALSQRTVTYLANTGSPMYAAVPITYECKTFFEIDPSNKIITARWEGNDCAAN